MCSSDLMDFPEPPISLYRAMRTLNPSPYIWFNGELVAWEKAQVHVLTHALHYASSVFEGIRAYKRAGGETTIFRLRDHIERLFDSCRLVHITPRPSIEDVERACVDVVRANGMEDAYIRPLVFVGEGAMGIYAPENPIRTSVIAWRWGAYLGAEALERGIRVRISSWARHHLSVSLAKGKIMGQYTNSTLAKREAKFGGYDEAIMLDSSGYVSEGTGENIFVVKNGVVRTPPTSAAILAGITRDTAIQLLRERGVEVREEMIARDELYTADEVFLTGTAAEITPVREIDHRKIGRGEWPITFGVQDAFFQIVKGSDAKHDHWLHFV